MHNRLKGLLDPYSSYMAGAVGRGPVLNPEYAHLDPARRGMGSPWEPGYEMPDTAELLGQPGMNVRLTGNRTAPSGLPSTLFAPGQQSALTGNTFEEESAVLRGLRNAAPRKR